MRTTDPLKHLHIGTAGWQVPKTLRQEPVVGGQLERYAQLFNAVEINTTFYRPHLPKTFARWAATVPEDFRFAVKLHQDITHKHRLADVRPAQPFIEMVGALGNKLGPLLVQLPPSLQWSGQAEEFLLALREVYAGTVVLEARHHSWAATEPAKVLRELKISGVAADPPLITDSVLPTGYPKLAYFRLHGSPDVYWSSYDEETLRRLADRVVALLHQHRTVWVIFDNTGAGAAAPNGLQLRTMIRSLLEDG